MNRNIVGCVCLEAMPTRSYYLYWLKKLTAEGGRAFSRSHLRAPSQSVIVRFTGNKYPARKNIQLYTHFLSICFIYQLSPPFHPAINPATLSSPSSSYNIHFDLFILYVLFFLLSSLSYFFCISHGHPLCSALNKKIYT